MLEADRLTPRAAKDGTLELLLEEWLAHAATSWSPKTTAVVRGYVKDPIVPALGSLSVAELTPADLTVSTANCSPSVEGVARTSRRP